MPGNLYGVSQPGFAFAPSTMGGDQACPSGSETNCFANLQPTAPGSGNWYGVFSGIMTVLLGATAPTALIIGARIGALADFDNFTVAPALLVNNATLMIPFAFYTAANQANFFPASAAFNITLTPTAQAVTAKNVGSRIQIQLFHGPDA